MDFFEAEDWLWCDTQYPAIVAYVEANQIAHGVICDSPEWFVAPYIGLWAVEDPADPGFVGTWVVAGDHTAEASKAVPFDHLPAAELSEPRDAIAAFAKRWATLAREASQGHAWQGSPVLAGDLASQAKQLSRQAQLLQAWVQDDEAWDED